MATSTPIYRHYETVILVRPDTTDAAQQTLRERVDEIVTASGGRTARWETWGKRRLSYEIKKQNKAHYLYANFVASQTTVREMERNLRNFDTVLKYQTVRLSDSVKLEEFNFEAVGAERSALFLSPEEAAAIERNYQREREWAAGASSRDHASGYAEEGYSERSFDDDDDDAVVVDDEED